MKPNLSELRNQIDEANADVYRAINLCKILDRPDLAKTMAQLEYIRTSLYGVVMLLPDKAA